MPDIEKMENPDLRNLALTDTAVDSNGVERIVTAATPEWEPAPTEASKEAIEHMAKMNEVFEAAATERQAKPKEAGEVSTEPTTNVQPEKGDGKDDKPKAATQTPVTKTES